tara:strand:+ start:23784 stop:24356 length:573 start_codon:yes stop_codon:yes gene_type:complete
VKLISTYRIVLVASLLCYSSHTPSEIGKDFNCKNITFNNLETVDDMKALFSVDLPKNWKINLYQDEVQSSIFAADTTKQLTETMLLDVTFIQNKINFDDAFLLKQEQEYLSENLIKIKSKAITFQEKSALYMVFKGKKGVFDYQICNTFIKVNASNFIFAKTEVYGDSLVNQRFCEAFLLLENIKLKNEA